MSSFFMFVSLILILMLSISIHDYKLWFSAILILLTQVFLNLKNKIVVSPLSFLTLLFFLYLVFNINYVSPVKNSESNYLLVLFILGYLISFLIDQNILKNIFIFIVSIFVVLSLWGIFQYISGLGYIVFSSNRANTIFYTPNTFAAGINLVLLPLLTLFLLGKQSKYILYILMILFSGLLVTQSRGGWIAFLSSFTFVFILIKTSRVSYSKIELKKVILSFILLFSVFTLYNSVGSENKYFSSYLDNAVRTDSVVSTMSHRFMLYDVAWQEIKKSYITGSGFHTFQYFQQKNQKEPYIGNTTRYVHNDYLQLWMETGLVGLLIFVSIYMCLIYCFIKYNESKNKYMVYTCLIVISGFTTFYVHALVDFIIYVPLLIFLYSLGLGFLGRGVSSFDKHSITINLSIIDTRYNLIMNTLFVLLILYLAHPAVAQVFYNKANIETNKLNIEAALSFYQLARTFDNLEADYYWREGALLMNAVKVNKHKISAERAEELFLNGMKISPFDSKNRLARAELHREYAFLLDNSESMDNVLKWNEQVLYWKPNDPVVQVEYLKTLIAAGNYEQAKIKIDDFYKINPKSEHLNIIDSLLKETI